MPIYQTNIWICENCGMIISTTEEVNPYYDPVVIPPNDKWEHCKVGGKELLCCPDCNDKNYSKKDSDK